MSWRHMYGRADVDPKDPKPFGTCDRCGIQYNLEHLMPQYQISGATVTQSGLLVCRFCRDSLAWFVVPQILPSDPVGLANARPEAYAIDEDDFRVTQDDDQRITEIGDDRVVDSSADEDLAGSDFTGS
ncbi:MAG TPA: hypothetical protein VI358_18025 [Pseudolabrys sp.]